MGPEEFAFGVALWVAGCVAGALACFAIGFPRAVRLVRRRGAAVTAPAPAPVPGATRESGLRRSRAALAGRLERLLSGRAALDDEGVEELEALLLGADIGVRTAMDLLEQARACSAPAEVRGRLEARALEILRTSAPPAPAPEGRPRVVLLVGVNGSGKTTTAAKLAARWISEGRSVLLAAADTFRAAAVEQLEVWAGRAGADLVQGEPGGDPAAVAFDAVRAGVARGVDVVLVDTAGRLQTHGGLMDELAKVSRAVGKELPGAPHEVLLVIDANTGQNAIRQAQEFSRAIGVTGIVLSKLDGTAKGGALLGVAQEAGIPVAWVGVGEGLADLVPFDAERFVRALFAPVEGEGAAAA